MKKNVSVLMLIFTCAGGLISNETQARIYNSIRTELKELDSAEKLMIQSGIATISPKLSIQDVVVTYGSNSGMTISVPASEILNLQVEPGTYLHIDLSHRKKPEQIIKKLGGTKFSFDLFIRRERYQLIKLPEYCAVEENNVSHKVAFTDLTLDGFRSASIDKRIVRMMIEGIGEIPVMNRMGLEYAEGVKLIETLCKDGIWARGSKSTYGDPEDN